MKRKSHIIKHNERVDFPRHVIFFDTETYEDEFSETEKELKLKLGCACYTTYDYSKKCFVYADWITFRTPEEFWNFVNSKLYDRVKIYIVAHNVSFDFRVVKGFKNMKRLGMETSKLIYNGTTNIFSFTKDRSKIVVLDNMNYFKSSLEILGKSIGVKKMQMPSELDINKSKFYEIDLEQYCKNDVYIMVKAWELYITFIKDNELGNFSNTIAGQAFNAYRHRFMDARIFVHNNKNVIDIERVSYHGGRTECFAIGKMPVQNYYLLDVNSMYPSVMKNLEYPEQFVRSYKNIDENLVKILLNQYCLIARVQIETNENVFPTKLADKLIFPIGSFETVLTTREIEYGIEHNFIKKYLEVIVYNKRNLFKDYVNFFYDKKVLYGKENNESFKFICKLFLNSLYGKFGQRNEQFEVIGKGNQQDGVLKVFDVRSDKMVTTRSINGVIEKSVGMVEGFNTFVAIPSHITADARIVLWNYFNIAGKNNVFYCDTDSMIVNKEGYDNCMNYIGEDLGMLSLKEKSTHLVINGPKDYEFAKTIIIKGIKANARKISETEFEQITFEGMAGAVRNGRTDKMIISKTNKHLKRNYSKGVVNDAGKVEPIKLSLQETLI